MKSGIKFLITGFVSIVIQFGPAIAGVGVDVSLRRRSFAGGCHAGASGGADSSRGASAARAFRRRVRRILQAHVEVSFSIFHLARPARIRASTERALSGMFVIQVQRVTFPFLSVCL
jgi:hypothetical protein